MDDCVRSCNFDMIRIAGTPVEGVVEEEWSRPSLLYLQGNSDAAM